MKNRRRLQQNPTATETSSATVTTIVPSFSSTTTNTQSYSSWPSPTLSPSFAISPTLSSPYTISPSLSPSFTISPSLSSINSPVAVAAEPSDSITSFPTSYLTTIGLPVGLLLFMILVCMYELHKKNQQLQKKVIELQLPANTRFDRFQVNNLLRV